jgi:CheY-like chemotaxis protein
VSEENAPKRVVLIVEDNPDDLLMTTAALRGAANLADVVSATSGAGALDYLLGAGGDPNHDGQVLPSLVVLDLHLPKVDGFEVLRRLRRDERTRSLPVVILTSSREEEDLLKGYNLGANSYVCKPVTFERFTEAVRQLGQYWLLLNEAPPEAREERDGQAVAGAPG